MLPSRPTLFLALLLISASVSDAQIAAPEADPDIVTDRPDITESSIVVPRANLQFENGWTWTRDQGTETIDASETLVRLGISSRTEFRLVAPNYLEQGSGGVAPSGFGDAAVGFKQQLGPLPGDLGLSVIVGLSLPTGSARASSHGFDPFIKFPWSKGLKRGWSIGGMQSFFSSTQERARNFTWEPTFYVEKELVKQLAAFAEYAADLPTLGHLRQVAHFGTTYRITAGQQFDFHFGFGLSRAAPAHFFALGYSFRVGRLWGR